LGVVQKQVARFSVDNSVMTSRVCLVFNVFRLRFTTPLLVDNLWIAVDYILPKIYGGSALGVGV
jgi:hypothetical protein